jgi:phosphotransferase system HPr-like phosphotransfer protein
MRVLMVSLSMLALAGCGSGRQVEVRTGPEPAAETAINLTNNLSQAVNVYVVSGGNDIFLKQVSANSVEHIPVAGVAAGSTVNLRAVTVDNTRTYTKNNVTLTSMYDWRLP